MRSLLPALNGLELRGNVEYLDDFVARIDVPSTTSLCSEIDPSSSLTLFTFPSSLVLWKNSDHLIMQMSSLVTVP
jgi:hypothetical protein